MIEEESLTCTTVLVSPTFNTEAYLVAFALKPSKALGSVAFSPDGLWIATSIANGYVTNTAVMKSQHQSAFRRSLGRSIGFKSEE